MGSFLRTSITDEGFIRGAARLLIADPLTVSVPPAISGLITLTTGATQYDPASGWTELGATKGGIQITRNNAEEEFDVDQIMGAIASQPTNWEMSVSTNLAEVTLDRLLYAWEGGTFSTNAGPTPQEKNLYLGQPVSYTQKRLAVLFQRPNGKIRAYIFRKTQRLPQETNLTYAKTGEQQSIPWRVRILADDSVTNPQDRFGVIYDQQ